MSESEKVSVSKAGGIMVAALLLSRILGLVRDTVMFSQFGVGIDTDSYRLAILIPDMIFMLVAGGGLSSAFIPVFSEYWHQDKRDEAWKVFSVIVTLTSIVALVLIGIAWVFTPQIVHYFQDVKPDTVVPGAIVMSRILLPAQFAFLVGSVLLATLYARRNFWGPALAPNVYNIGIILGAALLPWLAGLGVESMAWGALVGAIIGNLLLPAVMMLREGSSFRISFDTSLPGVKKFFILLLPVLLGFSLPSMAGIITQKFASSYGSDGVNTVLGAANNLMQAPLGIFGQSLALAAFPVLAEFVATNRMDRYRDQVGKTLRTVLYLGMASGALMWALAPQIVLTLYGYGQAMKTPEQLHAVADCLRIYAFGIFAWCAQPVLMRGFFSLQKTFLPVAIGTVMTAVFIALCVWAVNSSDDYRLLPWATNIAALGLAIALYLALERQVGALDRKALLGSILGTAVAAVVTAGAAYGLVNLWNPQGKLMQVVALFVVGLVGVWVFYFATKAMGMSETAYFDRAFKRLSKKG